MTATITKTKSAEAMGEYKPTAIDAQKAAADVLFLYAYGGGYDVRSKVELSGRGVKVVSGSIYHITEAAAERIKKSHTWACDF